MDLSIIILNYKTRGLLKNCLNGLKRYPPDCHYEIIVVDNSSKDGTARLVRNDFQELKYIEPDKNLGYAAGNNAGIRQATGSFILLLNTDIVVFDNSIDRLLNFMKENPLVAIAGAKLLNPDRTVQQSCLNFPSLLTPIYSRTILGRFGRGKKILADYRMQQFDHNQTREVDWVISSCMLIRKDFLDKHGLLDERFFVYFSDVDLCRRCWQNNYQVAYFCDTNIIHYYHRESAENQGLKVFFSPITRIHIKDWLKYLIKYKGQ